jgi:CRP-like cAMP-binding protein
MADASGRLVVSSALRERLLEISKVVVKRKGAVLFRRGDACEGMFLVCSGKVQMALDAMHPAFPPRLLGEGCVVGLPSAVAGSDYSLTAEVIEDAELAWVPQKELRGCLRENPDLCMEVMNILSREISETRAAIKCSGLPRGRRN